MKNLFKKIKDAVKKAFGKEGIEEKVIKTSGETFEKISSSKSPVSPGLEWPEKNIGKKGFEKTGRGREGVGQSSTLVPRQNLVKTNQEETNKKPSILVPRQNLVKTDQEEINKKPYSKFRRYRRYKRRKKDSDIQNAKEDTAKE